MSKPILLIAGGLSIIQLDRVAASSHGPQCCKYGKIRLLKYNSFSADLLKNVPQLPNIRLLKYNIFSADLLKNVPQLVHSTVNLVLAILFSTVCVCSDHLKFLQIIMPQKSVDETFSIPISSIVILIKDSLF